MLNYHEAHDTDALGTVNVEVLEFPQENIPFDSKMLDAM